MTQTQWKDMPEEKLQEVFRQVLLSEAPGANAVTEELTVGMDRLADFWGRHYLEEFIPHGGSKIKFITGRAGSGKTHLLNLLTRKADSLGYITVNLSARRFMLHDFREIYLEILRQIGRAHV